MEYTVKSAYSSLRYDDTNYGRKWRGTEVSLDLDEGERGEWKSWLNTQHSKNEDRGIQSHHFMQVLDLVGYILAFLPCLFSSLLFSAICKAFSDNHFAFLYFFFFFLFDLIFKPQTLYLFCQTSKRICHRYTCAPHPEPSSLLPPHTISLGCPSAPAPSIQYRALNLDWQLVSYMILHMFVWIFSN